jgi:hypothetical protein
VGLILHTATAGSLLIVKGSSTFASRTIPDLAQAIQIDGVALSFFGWPVVGIGQFFPAPAGPRADQFGGRPATSTRFGARRPRPPSP